MSATPIAFTPYPQNYSPADLTQLDSIFGGNVHGVSEVEAGVLALSSGDADQNGVIASPDANFWYTQTGLLFGYFTSDFDLNGVVNTIDLNGFWRTTTGKISQIP